MKTVVKTTSLNWRSLTCASLLYFLIFYFTCVVFIQQLSPPHQVVSVTFRALQVTKKVDILTPLGALYYNTGRYEEALQVYREATSLQPDNTDIWLAFVSMCTPTQRL